MAGPPYPQNYPRKLKSPFPQVDATFLGVGVPERASGLAPVPLGVCQFTVRSGVVIYSKRRLERAEKVY